jgi:hypothetical protein
VVQAKLVLLIAGSVPPATVLSRLAAAAVAASYSGSSAAAAAAAAASRNTFAAWAERVQGDPTAAAQQVRCDEARHYSYVSTDLLIRAACANTSFAAAAALQSFGLAKNDDV